MSESEQVAINDITEALSTTVVASTPTVLTAFRAVPP